MFSEQKQVVAIIGSSASGKTELAKRYASLNYNSYHHVWFVDVENLETAYRNLAKEWQLFKIQEIDALPIDVIIHTIHSELGKRGTARNRKSLIVFDNAPAGFMGSQFKGQLPLNADILVTSKDSDWPAVIDLSKDELQLTTDEGLEILQRWIPKEKYTDSAARNIVKHFANMPVVIAQAGRFIAQSSIVKMDGFLELFEKNKKEILNQGKLENPQGKGFIDIYISLKMTLLDIAQKEPKAIELLKYCAYLPGKNIPIPLLIKIFGTDLLSLNRYLRTLDTVIIVNKDTVTMHDLFQEIVGEEYTVQETEILSALAKNIRGFEAYLMISPKKALAIYQQGYSDALQSDDNSKTPYFTSWISYFCFQKGLYHEALARFQRALEINTELLGENHSDTCSCYLNTGTLLGMLGRYKEGLTYASKALEISKKLLGDEHQMTATCYTSVGQLLGLLGRYVEALDCHKKELEISKKILGEFHPKMSVSYHNVGVALGGLGKNEEALSYLYKALKIDKEAYGESDPETANTYSSIGTCLMRLGRQREATQFLQQALEVFIKTLGENHPTTALTYYNIGIFYTELGQYNEALLNYQKSLIIRKKTLGDTHPYTINSNERIEECLVALGRNNAAKNYKNKV